MVLRSLLQDLERNREPIPGLRDGVARTVLTMRFTSVFLFRCSQELGHRVSFLGGVTKQFNQLLTGADVAWQAEIGSGLVLAHPSGVVIGPGVKLGRRNLLQQGVTLGGHGQWDAGSDVSPVSGDDVSFGAGCKCIGAISIGSGAKIGANAVVLRDIPVGATAVGVPARVISQKDGVGYVEP